jgi:sterol 3beta-glucosyltransferase
MTAKITIITVGSRGDIQPFVALGRGLVDVGNQVTFCAPDRFAGMICDYSLNYAHMPSDFIDLIDTPQGQSTVQSPSRGYKLISQVKEILPAMLNAEWTAAQGSDLLVYHPKALGAYHIAEKLDIPAFASLSLPNTPTSAFPNPILPPGLVPRFLNRSSFKLTGLARAPFAGVINDWRREVLGLPKRSQFASEDVNPTRESVPTLYSYSQHAIPNPPDWPECVTATGYWFLDRLDSWTPPAELQAFLGSGPPPVYVGFGSMPSGNPATKTRLVVDALLRSGQRGLLATGWGGLQATELPDQIFALDDAPHDWLFPQMAAVVHHGGAGTTAAGLRAGVPTLVAPFFGDQPFWGRLVYGLGTGPAPIPQKKLTVDGLAAAIRQVAGDETMRRKAAALGEKIRAEDGVARGIEIIAACQ